MFKNVDHVLLVVLASEQQLRNSGPRVAGEVGGRKREHRKDGQAMLNTLQTPLKVQRGCCLTHLKAFLWAGGESGTGAVASCEG